MDRNTGNTHTPLSNICIMVRATRKQLGRCCVTRSEPITGPLIVSKCLASACETSDMGQGYKEEKKPSTSEVQVQPRQSLVSLHGLASTSESWCVMRCAVVSERAAPLENSHSLRCCLFWSFLIRSCRWGFTNVCPSFAFHI